jgi:hypothetical protein
MPVLLMKDGPLAGASPRKRKRVRALGRRTADLSALSQFHRRLERAGFNEVDAHIIIRLLAEELRNAGLA